MKILGILMLIIGIIVILGLGIYYFANADLTTMQFFKKTFFYQLIGAASIYFGLVLKENN